MDGGVIFMFTWILFPVFHSIKKIQVLVYRTVLDSSNRMDELRSVMFTVEKLPETSK